MRFRIAHTTRYLYSNPVALAPHVLRLRPRSDGAQRLSRFQMRIDPRPVGQTETLDLDGNVATEVWFLGETDSLEISTELEVETIQPNPFNYIVTHLPALSLPAGYPAAIEPALASYRVPACANGAVTRFAEKIAERAGGNTIGFLTRMTGEISEGIRYAVREDGEPMPAELTLARREGSCRDLAVLFIEAARGMGLAARFVSGYQLAGSQETHHLHAWAEVYLPGGGWRGYDPTLGLAIGDTHVAVAVGHTPALAAPVSGWFSGQEVTTRMHHDLRLELLPEIQSELWARPHTPAAKVQVAASGGMVSRYAG